MSDNITSKKILIEVEAQTEKLHSGLTIANSAIDRLTKSQEQITSNGKQNSQQFKDNASMIELWQSRISSATVQIDINSKALKASTGSIEQNKSMVAALTIEKQKLAVGIGNNSQKVTDLDARITALTATIEKQQGIFSAATERAKTYGKAFDDVTAGVEKVSKASDGFGKVFADAGKTFEPLKSSVESAIKVVGPLKTALSAANNAYASFRSGLASGQGVIAAFKNSIDGSKKALDTFKEGAGGSKDTVAALGNDAKGGEEALGSLTTATGEGTSGFKLFKIAIAETGLGLLILVVASLIEQMKESKPIMDMVNGAIAALGAVVGVVTDAIKGLFTNFSKIGDFLSNPIDSIMKFGSALKDAAVDAYNLVQAQEKLKTAMSAQEVENASLKDKINLLKESASNSKRTTEQRIDDLNNAQAAEAKYYDKNKALTDKQRENAIESVRLNKKLTDDELTSLKVRGTQYAQELLEEDKLTQAQFDAIKKADLDIIASRKEHNDAMKGLTDQKQAIADADAEKKKQEKENRRQAGIQAKKVHNEQIQGIDAEASRAKEEAQATARKLNRQQTMDARHQELDEQAEAYQKQLQSYQTFTDNYKHLSDKEQADNLKKYEAYLSLKAQLKLKYDSDVKKTNDKFDKDILVAQTAANEELLKADQKKIDDTPKPEEKLAAEKQLLLDEYSFKINLAEGDIEKQLTLADELNKKLAAVDAAYQKKKLEDARALQQKKQTEDDALAKKRKEKIEQDAKQIGATVLSFALNSIKQASDAKVAALEKDKASELSNTSLTSAQKLAINQKYKKQEDKIKAKAFKEQQEISIMQALINGAIAITKAPADLGPVAGAIAVAAIIASTAAQVASIAKQKPPMAKGGYFQSDGKGALLSGYSRTDDTNAYLRSGEAVVVSEAMQVPWARNLVSAINVGFGGRDFSMPGTSRGYAVGGIFTDGGDANRYYNQPVNDQKNLANTIAYQMINNFPPVYVDVKDVNNQQNILAQTINRVNL